MSRSAGAGLSMRRLLAEWQLEGLPEHASGDAGGGTPVCAASSCEVQGAVGEQAADATDASASAKLEIGVSLPLGKSHGADKSGECW
eukprot:11811965-Alexandrium_andersonii.AAC.1